MFRMWKVTYTADGYAPLMDAPDAAGGGGGADLGDAGDGSQPSGETVDGGDGGDEVTAAGDESEREEDLDGLILDDQDDDQPSRTPEESLKALQKKNRKLRRQLAKHAPLVKRLQGVDIDDLVLSKRQYSQLAEQIRSNPKLRALFNGDADEPAEARRTPAAEPDDAFDEAALPFDANANPTNRYFADLAKENFENKRLMKQFAQRLDGFEGQDRARTEAQTRENWKTTASAAAAQIKDEGVRATFKDLIALAYKDPEMRKRFTAPQLVGHYLKLLKVNPTEAAKATTAAAQAGARPPVRTAATQQRIAEANKHLPRTATATGTPAPANSQRPTLQSLRRHITGAAR